ncbi:hypothetical protein [Pseudomonas sp. CGJS7]|uniref:hypothetical protein n=1 Tax=Pseudomonas sp. CGJS7 TaxID=3109348 RepID=UPI00300885D5
MLSREDVLNALTEFRAELRARKEALDEAFHFDDRGSVWGAYQGLIRIADTHAGLLEELDDARPLFASAEAGGGDAYGGTIEAVGEIMVVLRHIAVAIERYHDSSNKLARMETKLAAAFSRL